MTKEVSINLFDVEWSDELYQPPSDTINEYARLPLALRWRDDIRLEQIRRAEEGELEVYLLDFSKRRDVGPGRLGHRAPIDSIELAEDEDFGEETAALYVPERRWLLVLHNQAGIGPGRMMQYLNSLDPGNRERHFDYAVRPKLDPAALHKYAHMGGISNVAVTATVDALAASGVVAGQSLAAATRSVGAKRIRVELLANDAYQRGDRLIRRVTRALVDRLMERDPGEVSNLEVKGEVDGQDQLIDLIEHKVRRKYPATELTVLHHRYTLESRSTLLRRTLRHWNANL